MSGRKCDACGKTAYPQESMTYDKLVFHTACFKCLQCRGSLTLSNVAQLNGDIYCKNCFVQLFKRRGRYSIFKKDPATGADVEVTVDGPIGDDTHVTDATEVSDAAPIASTDVSTDVSTDATSTEAKADSSASVTPQKEEEKNLKPSAYLSGLPKPKPLSVATSQTSTQSPTSPTSPTPASPLSPLSPGGTKKFSTAPKCTKCALAAYPEESVKYDGILYHKACFKCLNCKSSLSISAVAQFQGDIYCKNCFVRMFKTRGTYNIFKKDGEPLSPTAAATAEPASPTEPPVGATAALSISS